MSDTYHFPDFNSLENINIITNETSMNMPLISLDDIKEIKTILESWNMSFLLQTCIGKITNRYTQ